MSISAESNSVKGTVINCSEESGFRGISAKNFIKFKRHLELYEKQIEEQGRKLSEEIVSKYYNA